MKKINSLNISDNVTIKSPALDGCLGVVKGEKYGCYVVDFKYVPQINGTIYFQLPCVQLISKNYCEICDMDKLINAVRKYAEENCNVDCWNYVLEYWDDYDITEEIRGCNSKKEAIDKIEEVITMQYDYNRCIRGTVW